MSATRSPSGVIWAQRFLLRPALLIWAVLAVGVMGLILGDILFPERFAPFGRFLSHRDNLDSPEWRAALAAKPQIDPEALVLVDTDNRVFYFTLRYLSYPTPVLLHGGRPVAGHLAALPVERVVYRSGELRVAEETSR